MSLRKAIMAVGIAMGMVAVGVILTKDKDRKKRDVVDHLHPNIDAAKDLVDSAFSKIAVAQHANEWDWDGHAARAKDLLRQANHELKQAAEAADRIRRQITMLTPQVQDSIILKVEPINGPGAVLRLG